MMLNGNYSLETGVGGNTCLVDEEGFSILTFSYEHPYIEALICEWVAKAGGTLFNEAGKCLVGDLDQLA